MNSFKRENIELPLSAVWLMNSIAEYKGKQELYAKQSPQIVNQAIERQFGEFSLSDIERECPAVSRDMIKIIFRELQKVKKIECLGKGKSAKWKKI